MKKVAVLALVALALVLFTGIPSFAQGNAVTVQLNAQNGSGETGTATITDMGNGQVQVVVNVSNAPAVPQPIHIHDGTCANLDPKPKFPLTNVVDGKSTTMVNTTLQELGSESYAINIHKSATEAATYVSCGDIKVDLTSGGAVGMPATGSGDQALIVIALTLFGLALVTTGVRLARTKA